MNSNFSWCCSAIEPVTFLVAGSRAFLIISVVRQNPPVLSGAVVLSVLSRFCYGYLLIYLPLWMFVLAE